MADSDDDDYHFIGTPLVEEVESRASQRPRPGAVGKDASQTRSLPIHKQEVTDEEGRRRFHGAFTGGFSAGYFNTVGSQAGWAPATFKSSRSDRASARQQEVEDFLDEDELEEARKQTLQTTAQYDTFGSTAAEAARRTAAQDAADRPSTALGPLPEELIAPVADSVGIRLLQKMGWRQGRGIGTGTSAGDAAEAGGRASRWGRVAGVGVENVPIYDLPPKTDVHGLGFDPYKNAEEFRGVKRERDNSKGDNSEGLRTAKRARGVAFGSGVLDEDDVYGIEDDYVTADGAQREGLNFEIASDEEPDDIVAARRRGKEGQFRLPGGVEERHLLQSREQLRKKHDLVPGFVRAAAPLPPRIFPPPKVPPDFRGRHVFPAEPPQGGNEAIPAGGDTAAAPTDDALVKAIETLARFVARVGPAMEVLATSRNAGDPAFRFLTPGGEGGDYYRARLAALRGVARASAPAVGRRSAPLTADERGVLLGEAQLPQQAPASSSLPAIAPRQAPDITGIAAGDRDALRSSLASTFTAASEEDTSKDVRGGLRQGRQKSPVASAAGEAAPDVAGAPSAAAASFLASIGGRFASTGTVEFALTGGLQQPAAPKPPEAAADTRRPTRRVEEWRPEPLLCKRFNVPDPYKGRPAELKMSRFKTDHLALPETSAVAHAAALPPPPPLPPPQAISMPPPPPRFAPAETADAAQLADAFLTSLGVEPHEPHGLAPPAPKEATAVGQTLPPPPGLDADEDVTLGFAEKPINLFKAIFEDSESEEEEDAQGGAEPPSAEGGEGEVGVASSETLSEMPATSAHAGEASQGGVPLSGRETLSGEGGERRGGFWDLPAGETIAQQARRRAESRAAQALPNGARGRDGGMDALRERALAAAGRLGDGGYAVAESEGVAGSSHAGEHGGGAERRASGNGSVVRQQHSELSQADREQLAVIAAALKRVKKEERKKKRKGRDKAKKPKKDSKKGGKGSQKERGKKPKKKKKEKEKSSNKQRSASPLPSTDSDSDDTSVSEE